MKLLNNLFRKPALLVIACIFTSFVSATTVTTTTPTSAQVQVQSYDYDGTTFSGNIYVRVFLVVLFVYKQIFF